MTMPIDLWLYNFNRIGLRRRRYAGLLDIRNAINLLHIYDRSTFIPSWVLHLPVPKIAAHGIQILRSLKAKFSLSQRGLCDEIRYISFPKILVENQLCGRYLSTNLRSVISYLKSNPVTSRIAARMSKTLIPLPFPRLYALKRASSGQLSNTVDSGASASRANKWPAARSRTCK